MRNEKGFSLIEVIITIALLGIIGVAFLGALSTASRALFIADERATAESLARSQMEYVKNQDYITADAYDPGVPGSGEVIYDDIGDTDGYTIWSVNRADDTVEDIIGVPWDSQNNLPEDTDAGLQKIRLVVKHHGKEIFTFISDDGKKITLEGYKVKR